MSNFLILTLIILAAWLLSKIFPVGKKHLYGRAKGPGKLSSHNHAHEAVSIHSYKECCTAAEQVAGQRFLSSEAPPLPLESCTSQECHCVYMHHSDRRGGGDRRLVHETKEAFLSSSGYQFRCHSGGRRVSDLAFV
jgi:hypothetical protein